jgi:hypothetical protein
MTAEGLRPFAVKTNASAERDRVVAALRVVSRGVV